MEKKQAKKRQKQPLPTPGASALEELALIPPAREGLALETRPPAPELRAAAPAGAFSDFVARNCDCQEYRPIKVPSFEVTGEITAYASPDSTYAVTRKLLEGARKSILIGIYDFTARYMEDLLVRAIKRGVTVTLMLDLDSRAGETELFEQLARSGAHCTSAPSCANKNPKARYFSSSHEKIIVIDDAVTLVQSGNYSNASIPRNSQDGVLAADFVPGNRDMGLMVRSPELARFMTKLLRGDIDLARKAPRPRNLPPSALPAPAEPVPLFEAPPEDRPNQLFPSRTYNLKSVTVQPVLTPDNYMTVVPDLLASATRSIFIEQQYIRARQPLIRRLLASIAKARAKNPELDIRIIVAAPMGRESFEKENDNIDLLEKDFGLRPSEHIRILDPRRFVHCHNKLIVIDEKRVLVGSQNWSDTAVAKNREASLLVPHAPVSKYFARIFKSDWQSASRHLVMKWMPRLMPVARLASAAPMSPGDYDEV